MSRKLNVPSVVATNTEGVPFGTIVFLQAVEDALKTVDNNVVYKGDINVNVAAPRLRAISAQGQAFSVSGTSLASGDDYAALVQNVKIMLEDLNDLRTTVTSMKNQLQGS